MHRKEKVHFSLSTLFMCIYLFKLINSTLCFRFSRYNLFFLLSPDTDHFILAVQDYLSGSLCRYNYLFSCKICLVTEKIRGKICLFYFVFCNRYRWFLNLDLCVFLVEIELDYCGSVDLSG